MLRVELEAGDLSQDDAGVALPFQDLTQWQRNLDRGERARRDLVDERLEEVEVAAVDQRDVDVVLAQLADRLQAAEASAHDDDLHLDDRFLTRVPAGRACTTLRRVQAPIRGCSSWESII